jgi:hypothetical protein
MLRITQKDVINQYNAYYNYKVQGKFQVEAIQNYEAKNARELSFVVGDIINVLQKVSTLYISRFLLSPVLSFLTHTHTRTLMFSLSFFDIL